jgi:hypothetical protein
MDPISKEFVARLESSAEEQRVPVVQFRKGERKDDIASEFIRKFKQEEGVLFIGKAQEKTRVFHTERRRNPEDWRGVSNIVARKPDSLHEYPAPTSSPTLIATARLLPT